MGGGRGEPEANILVYKKRRKHVYAIRKHKTSGGGGFIVGMPKWGRLEVCIDRSVFRKGGEGGPGEGWYFGCPYEVPNLCQSLLHLVLPE